ncbi:unnamed protein product [Rhizophagus irregularis]|nr:unnamed protein product [Rhizophagus irregularis]
MRGLVPHQSVVENTDSVLQILLLELLEEKFRHWSILFCIHRCAWIPEKIKRGFKKQERILFKIAIQSSSFGCIRDEDYHIDSLGRVQCIGKNSGVSSWNPHNGYSLIIASLRNNISRAEKIDEYFKIMVFNNREWLKVTDQPISKVHLNDVY